MASAFQLSVEQQEVVAARDARLMVVAAAGAGKTRVLVERYLRHVVEEGIRPDQILTITFTRKAAAEMKSRIVASLRDLGRYAEAQVAETGPVQTIHSFCERLLRENALEAGLDPQFEILTSAHAGRLAVQCIRDVLASDLEDEPHAAGLLAYVTGHFRYNVTGPYAALEGDIERTLDALRASGYSREEIASWHASPEALVDRWQTVLMATMPEPVRQAFVASDASDLRARLTAAYKSGGERKPAWVKGKEGSELEALALAHTCGLVQIACGAWWRLEAEMSKLQALDFTALEARAVRLLEQSEVTRDRICRQYKVVMVDESQDVNPVQYRLLDRMNPDCEMRVGDAQQSIYGFRQADVRLFEERIAAGSPHRLTRNYRSEEGILRFVDVVFAHLWRERYTPMLPRPQVLDFDDDSVPSFDGVEIWRHPAKDSDLTAHYVLELLTEGIAKRDICVLVRDGKGAADIQIGLEGQGIECRIAGGSEKFYTRLEVRDLANALRATADPYDDFSLLACLRSPMVGISIDSVALLAQSAPVIEALPSFEPPLEADQEKLARFQQWFLPLRAYADRFSAWEVLSELFARSDYLNALARRPNGGQLLANVRKLFVLATAEPELGPLEFAERIREIQSIRHKEGDAPAGAEDADVVTIMTVHKSKGLQFPVVILPQTYAKVSKNTPEIVVEPRFGLVAAKYAKCEFLMHSHLGEQLKQRNVQEEERVLYVAMTRAQKRLCICLYDQMGPQTLAKMISDAMKTAPTDLIRTRQQKDDTAG